MQKTLRLVHREREIPEIEETVQYASRLTGAELAIDFSVWSSRPLHLNPAWDSESSRPGLWDFDVVEVFVQVGVEGYVEFQVSPLNQFFELKVLEPRRRFERDFRSGFGHGAQIHSREGAPARWSAQLRIPLEGLGWNGDLSVLRGGAFSILGESGARSYSALHLSPQEKPDFHLPERFGPLL